MLLRDRRDVITRVVYSPASQCNITASTSSSSSATKSKFRRSLAIGVARYDKRCDTCGGFRYRVRRASKPRQPDWQDIAAAIRKTRKLRVRLRHVLLLHLLFEAHFLPCHLTILLLFSSIYTVVTPTSAIHPSLAWTFWFTASCGARASCG